MICNNWPGSRVFATIPPSPPPGSRNMAEKYSRRTVSSFEEVFPATMTPGATSPEFPGTFSLPCRDI